MSLPPLPFPPESTGFTTNLSIALSNPAYFLDRNDDGNRDNHSNGRATTCHPPLLHTEPLPIVNYDLIHNILFLSRPYLDRGGGQRAFKRFDYLVDARQRYYHIHTKFEESFRELADAFAHAELLDGRVEQIHELEKTFPNPTEGQAWYFTHLRCEVEIRKRKNNMVMAETMRRVEVRVSRRFSCTRHITLFYPPPLSYFTEV